MTDLIIYDLRYHLYVHHPDATDGAPLVLLHGFTGSGAEWDEFARGTGRTLIAPDLMGHGATHAPADPQRYAMDGAAADVAELIRQMSAEPVHLLGYSMGGRLALYIAQAYPELLRSLTLESASPGLMTPAERAARRASDSKLADAIEQDGVPQFVTRWERIPLFASQARLSMTTRKMLRARRLANQAMGLANSLRGMGTGSQPSLWPRLAELALPALLITGAEDEKFRAINRQMADRMPQAQLVVVGAAGHAVHLEQPERFRQIVLEFVADHDPDRSETPDT
ncbi:MAG: 2-succinyl-6-hydroxy-2,4-cyclohexadiene-1-carboxylate synthase [Caldilineaceae bacterium]|nr:2-succinyl-6-hydroxy-2,4-cyclohexadiene-1-carboxylate synthase [Caldilineaceae bacterium]